MSRCHCGHCSVELLANAREYRCCKEVGECLGKFTFEGKEPLCITEHWEYLLLTHEAVLTNVGPLLVQKSGMRYKQRNTFRVDNEYLRAVAYRWILKWICGYLGWNNARPLPACIYTHIRKQYPSTETKGFMSAQQRE